MAVKLTTTCDRCKAAVEYERTKLVIECGPLRHQLQGNLDGSHTLDFCGSCSAGLLEWIREMGASSAAAAAAIQNHETRHHDEG